MNKTEFIRLQRLKEYYDAMYYHAQRRMWECAGTPGENIAMNEWNKVSREYYGFITAYNLLVKRRCDIDGVL